MKMIHETILKDNLFSMLDQAGNNCTPMLITRNNSKSLVILSLEGFEAIEKLVESMENALSQSRLENKRIMTRLK